jgi:hypothetical protein
MWERPILLLCILINGKGCVDWIDMAQDMGPVEDSCEYSIEPSGSIKCWEVLEWLPS